MQQPIQNIHPISVNQIPDFNINVYDDQLQYRLRQINATLYNNQKQFDKIKKQLKQKPNQLAITQSHSIISTEIDIDPLLLKILIKRNQKKKIPPQQTTLLRKSARDLAKKVNYMTEGINYLYQQLKLQEKKMSTLETQLPSKLNESVKYIQKRVEDAGQSQQIFNQSIKQNIEIKMSQVVQKIKQNEKKTLWQINDCKSILNTRINEQYVKDANAQLQLRLNNKIKQHQMRTTIDPERILKIENKLYKIDGQYNSSLIEQAYKFKNLTQKIEIELLKKTQYNQNNMSNQRRLAFMNSNIAELTKKNIFAQQNQKQTYNQLKILNDNTSLHQKQIKRINQLIKNMKLGQQLQKMLENLDPHKLCQIDNILKVLSANSNKYQKQLDQLHKDQDKLRIKCNYLSALVTQNKTPKIKKQDIQPVVTDVLNNNLYIKKVLYIQGQIADTKTNHQMLNNLDKRVAKLQKQIDMHGLDLRIKAVQQYIKKQILIMGAKLTQFQVQFKQDQKKRPSSAGRNLQIQRVNSTINFKKLYPVNCIGHFGSPTGPSVYASEYVNDTGSTRGKALSILMNSRQK